MQSAEGARTPPAGRGFPAAFLGQRPPNTARRTQPSEFPRRVPDSCLPARNQNNTSGGETPPPARPEPPRAHRKQPRRAPGGCGAPSAEPAPRPRRAGSPSTGGPRAAARAERGASGPVACSPTRPLAPLTPARPKSRRLRARSPSPPRAQPRTPAAHAAHRGRRGNLRASRAQAGLGAHLNKKKFF